MNDTSHRLLVATTNQGKIRELEALLAGLPWQVLRPSDLDLTLEVEETGTTFLENAQIKARAYFAASGGITTLAEDSGIEIDALRGEPGVCSARYHGLPDGPIKNAHILELLAGVPKSRRTCRYRCTIVLIEESGEEHHFAGVCAGRIAFTPSGENGFGYDPIMELPRYGQTMADLPDEEKNRISHRARAARLLIRFLARLRSELGSTE
jgi:XTP/dITP diphosphohydrolase